VIPVDINLVPPRASTSGCEATDFAGLDFSGPTDIALIQRGTCTFADKATNAEAAGAEAVIIFNQGNTPDREALIVGTLAPATPAIPVVGASFADGEALAQAGSTAHVRVDPPETRTDVNVIAERPGSNDDNVVMAGAHLDSVTAGPGHQRQRVGLGRPAGDGADDGQGGAGEHAPVCLVGRRGVRVDRLDRLRRGAVAGRAGPDRAVPLRVLLHPGR
jgi:PA domain/Peptidase family M28